MPSLRQILAAHAPVLLLDAASARTQVGWLEVDQARWQSSDAEAGVALFTAIDQLQVNVAQAGAFVFCDGPGSILGIRTAAMALRTWTVLKPRPVFSYTSLAVVSHALGRPDAAIFVDARRETWHVYQMGLGPRRVTTPELPAVRVMPEHFRHWAPLPAGVTPAGYNLADLWPKVIDADLLRDAPSPDAFLSEEPSYVKWTPRIHRAPGSA
jgi:tRNA threonylcarbamoyladenosine biosynthesis protein TsaB